MIPVKFDSNFSILDAGGTLCVQCIGIEKHWHAQTPTHCETANQGEGEVGLCGLVYYEN